MGHSRVKSHSCIDRITPGEILVWSKLNPPRSRDTGHMAIVLESPVKVSEGKWRV